MKDEEIYDLILDKVNNGELVMKDGKIYAPEYAPKEGVYKPKGCDICGKTPSEVEPRFGYHSCEEHSKLSPVEFSKLGDKTTEGNK